MTQPTITAGALHIGVKEVRAVPMNRKDYNDLRGWTVPSDENPADDGFLVEYLDGGKSNVEGFSGYVSWSPKDVFERAYRSCEGMSFGLAIEAMKLGKKVARAGWNGNWGYVPVPRSRLHIPSEPSTASWHLPGRNYHQLLPAHRHEDSRWRDCFVVSFPD